MKLFSIGARDESLLNPIEHDEILPNEERKN